MISPLSPTRLTHVLNVPRSRLWCQELNSPRADLQAVFSPRVLSPCCIPPATNAREPNALPRYDLLTSEWVTARSLKRRGNHVSNSVARCKRVGFKLSSLLCLIAYCWPYRKALPDVSNGTANLRGRWASSVGRMREKWSHTSAFHDDETQHVIARNTPPWDLPHWGKIFQLPFSIRSQFPKEHMFYGPGKPSLGPFGNQLWFFSPDSINSF